jgi:predicted acyltransferase
MPINKQLWTSSFALFMAGLDFVLLALFVYFIDERKWQRPVRPFVILGMNAIAIYMLSELLEETLNWIQWQSGAAQITLRSWLYANCFAPFAPPYVASLLWALAFVLTMYAAAYALYRRKWFLRV